MKKILLSVALAGVAMACRSTSTEVTDTSAPTGDCGSCEMACDGCEETSECTGEAEAQVCPVTGKSVN